VRWGRGVEWKESITEGVRCEVSDAGTAGREVSRRRRGGEARHSRMDNRVEIPEMEDGGRECHG